MKTILLPGLLLLLAFGACRKKIEVIREVPVEKKNSWTEINRFSGTERIFLSSGTNGQALFFQQPFYFTALQNQDINNGITVYGSSLPTDVYLKIPISANFSAMPFQDSIIRIVNNYRPFSDGGAWINIRQLDPQAVSVEKNFLTLFKSMAINQSNHLLATYRNTRPDRALTLLLAEVKLNTASNFADTVATRLISIPRVGFSDYVRHIAAIDDYFLVDVSGNGIYKIRNNGQATRVFDTRIVDAFYTWKGRVYAHAEWDRILVSDNRGDTWQEFFAGNASMTLAIYKPVKDSLAGAYRDNLFTLKWDGNNYTQRFLKNDGLEGAGINGIEILRDTVYLATTKGLFVKPVSGFFEGK